jgi:transposase
VNGRRAKRLKAEEQSGVRRWAVEQIVLKGARAEDVAAGLGYDRSTVFSWVKRYKEGGLAALDTKLRSGRPLKLTLTQRVKLRRLIVDADPRQLRFPFALWTREMVAELIDREFGIVMSVSAVGRMLRRAGLSPQRPLWRAYQADPDAVEAWKAERFPAIRAEAAKVGAVVLFQDEASLRSDFHSGTTWGVRGETPVVNTTGARFRVNMISAVSAQGALKFVLTDGNVDSDVFIDFCQRLAHDYGDRPVFMVVDGHSSHKSKKTKEWVASTKGRFQLFYLPGYSPQLNPDEWVWNNVKSARVGRAGIDSHDDLKSKAVGALRRLAEMPEIVRGFFRDPDLRYITACES